MLGRRAIRDIDLSWGALSEAGIVFTWKTFAEAGRASEAESEG